MRYLLDTTLLIDHAHGHEPAMQLLQRLYEEGAELFTCDVVVCEALSGGSDEHRQVISRLLNPLDFVATDPAAARAAGNARWSATERAASSASATPSSRRSLAAWTRRSSRATVRTSNGRACPC